MLISSNIIKPACTGESAEIYEYWMNTPVWVYVCVYKRISFPVAVTRMRLNNLQRGYACGPIQIINSIPLVGSAVNSHTMKFTQARPQIAPHLFRPEFNIRWFKKSTYDFDRNHTSHARDPCRFQCEKTNRNDCRCECYGENGRSVWNCLSCLMCLQRADLNNKDGRIRPEQ